MSILQWTFKLLTFCGCWRPIPWSSLWKTRMYNIYTISIMLVIHTFTFTEFMDIILNVENSDDFSDNFYMFLAMMISCCKMSSLLLNRKDIITLLNILTKEPCKPVDDEEMKLQRKFDRHIRTTTIRYTVLVETTITSMAITSLFTNLAKRKLTFRAWLPYDYSTRTSLFYFTYVHQLIGLMAGSLLHVACDGVICGFLVFTCSQIELLEHRLKKITNNNQDILRKCIRHHDCIYGFATMVNERFKAMIFIQFLVSTLVICFNLYRFTKMKSYNLKLLEMVLYMSCMLTQIFFYCWYGNKVKLKVSDTIFKLDWTALNKDIKKMLLMIMNRSTKSIEFTSTCIVSMNLDSFVNLLKTSYSAYNILQQT